MASTTSILQRNVDRALGNEVKRWARLVWHIVTLVQLLHVSWQGLSCRCLKTGQYASDLDELYYCLLRTWQEFDVQILTVIQPRPMR